MIIWSVSTIVVRINYLTDKISPYSERVTCGLLKPRFLDLQKTTHRTTFTVTNMQMTCPIVYLSLISGFYILGKQSNVQKHFPYPLKAKISVFLFLGFSCLTMFLPMYLDDNWVFSTIFVRINHLSDKISSFSESLTCGSLKPHISRSPENNT